MKKLTTRPKKAVNSPIKLTKNGFTLLELLLSVTIIALLAGLSIPVYQTFQVKTDLDAATLTVAENLRRAQVLSQSVEGDSQWGVNIQSGNITLFKGSTYAGRDSTYDETTSISNVISPSGDSEIVFAKFTGDLTTPKTINLQSLNSNTQTLTVNEKGTVEY